MIIYQCHRSFLIEIIVLLFAVYVVVQECMINSLFYLGLLMCHALPIIALVTLCLFHIFSARVLGLNSSRLIFRY
jgi:hypothetical protein